MIGDLAYIAPMGVVTILGLILLVVGVFSSKESSRAWLGYVASFGFALALGAVCWLWDQAPIAFENDSFALAFSIDHFSLAMMAVILIGALLTTLTAVHYLPEHDADHFEYYPLVAFATLGMMALVCANDLLTMFVSIEVMSISVYILAGFKRQSAFATEAAMKYFVMGAFASGVLLMGIAFVYGATGTIAFTAAAGMPSIAESLSGAGLPSDSIAAIGILFLIVGFGFKIAAAPFHMWTPDVYEGAPAPVAGFMAVAVKTAAFGGLANMLLVGFGEAPILSGVLDWTPLIAGLALVSMCVGNLMALAQKNLKRLLAYSAIAHTGYMLMALIPAADSPGAEGVLGGGLIFYLLAYTLANAAAFGVAAALSGGGSEDVSEHNYAGLARRRPLLGLTLAISVLSLLGIPVTAGFVGKLSVFSEVLSQPGQPYLWLVIAAVVNSVISAWYYLRILVVAFMREESEPIRIVESAPLSWSVGLAALLSVVVGVLPDSALETAKKGALAVELREPTPSVAATQLTVQIVPVSNAADASISEQPPLAKVE